MEPVKVSACIVTYNDRDKVLNAIESLLRHTKGVDLQVYISDNGSTDGTAEAIRTSYPQVDVLENKENIGFGAGHNKVLPMLESQYHFVVNPDIILTEDVVSGMCRYLSEHPQVGLAVPRVCNEDGTEQYLPKLTPKFIYLLGGRIGFLSKYRDIYTMKDTVFSGPIRIDFCSGCFMALPTEVFRAVGGFDPRYFMYFEDADLTRTIGQNYDTMFCPQFSVIHLWERAGAKHLKYFLIQVQSMFRYFRKWRKIDRRKARQKERIK